MIASLEGIVTYQDLRFIVVNVGGVGYKVSVTGQTTEKFIQGEKVSLWTYLAVRENALDLYGFLTRDELEFFELLISISGIGPKTALSILNIASIAMLRQAISSGDTSHLIKVSGIGKKNAEKIVLELKDKLGPTREEDTAGHYKNEADAIAALNSLGYSQKEARDALKEVPKEITGTGEKVKHALKTLGSKVK